MIEDYIDFVKYSLRHPILGLKLFLNVAILKRDYIKVKNINLYKGTFYYFMKEYISFKDIEKIISPDEYIVNIKNLGKFYIKNRLVILLIKQLFDYDILNVQDKVVLDIGAYVGDSAIYFIRRGAKKVYTYEAVKETYNILIKNIELNNLKDKIIPINKGIDCNKGENYINLSYGSTGLEIGNEKIETISIKDVFEEIYNKEG
ncbi:FkbM family methyltransferase [Nanobdella aerobiophila]|nr:FkbM family methyltransferase [Nanobdella aerobiophila]